MSIADYLRANEAQVRQMRESGEAWETIAALLQNETGEEVNLASLRKTYSRLFGGNEAPAEIEKRVEKTVTKRQRSQLEFSASHEPPDQQKNNGIMIDANLIEDMTNKINYIKSERDRFERELTSARKEIDKLSLDDTNIKNQNMDELISQNERLAEENQNLLKIVEFRRNIKNPDSPEYTEICGENELLRRYVGFLKTEISIMKKKYGQEKDSFSYKIFGAPFENIKL